MKKENRKMFRVLWILIPIILILLVGNIYFATRKPQNLFEQMMKSAPEGAITYQGQPMQQRPATFQEIFPAWLPDGYRANRTGVNTYEGIQFRADTRPSIYYFQRYADESFPIEKGLEAIETLPLSDGSHALLVQSDQMLSIIATRGDYTFYIKGEVDEKVLQRMLESILEKL